MGGYRIPVIPRASFRLLETLKGLGAFWGFRGARPVSPDEA